MDRSKKKWVKKKLHIINLNQLVKATDESFDSVDSILCEVNRLYDFEKRIRRDIDYVKQTNVNYKDFHYEVNPDSDSESYWCGCGGVSFGVEIFASRLETDKEFAYRLKIEEAEVKRETKAKKIKDNKDLKEYERLKKKFG